MTIFLRTMYFELANLASFEDMGESSSKTRPSGVYPVDRSSIFVAIPNLILCRCKSFKGPRMREFCMRQWVCPRAPVQRDKQ